MHNVIEIFDIVRFSLPVQFSASLFFLRFLGSGKKQVSGSCIARSGGSPKMSGAFGYNAPGLNLVLRSDSVSLFLIFFFYSY